MKTYTDVFCKDFENYTLQLEFKRIFNEHKNQWVKWGRQDITLFEWITYLTEEVGELAKEVSELEYREGNLSATRIEATQVAALAVKIMLILSNTLNKES